MFAPKGKAERSAAGYDGGQPIEKQRSLGQAALFLFCAGSIRIDWEGKSLSRGSDQTHSKRTIANAIITATEQTMISRSLELVFILSFSLAEEHGAGDQYADESDHDTG